MISRICRYSISKVPSQRILTRRLQPIAASDSASATRSTRSYGNQDDSGYGGSRATNKSHRSRIEGTQNFTTRLSHGAVVRVGGAESKLQVDCEEDGKEQKTALFLRSILVNNMAAILVGKEKRFERRFKKSACIFRRESA